MSTSRPVYAAHDIPDLFNTLPVVLGFRPAESLVAIATYGPRRRLGFRVRVDLEPSMEVDDLADVVVGHLRRHDADGAIVLALTEHQQMARALLRAVEDRLDRIVPVVVARSDGSRYWVDDVAWCPRAGVPYETSDHHPAVVQAVVAGQRILPDRDALVRRFAADEQRVAAFEPVLAEVLPHVLGVAGRHPDDLVEAAMADLRSVLERLEVGIDPDDSELAALCLWLLNLPVRDAVWARIDHDTAQRYLDVLTHLGRSLQVDHVAPVLSLAAFAAWLTGDGAQALIALDRATACDPGYSLAGLVGEIVEAGTSPEFWREAGPQVFPRAG